MQCLALSVNIQQTTDMEIEGRVNDIIENVRANGDAALREYSEKIRWRKAMISR